jgi:hypothetical protein
MMQPAATVVAAAVKAPVKTLGRWARLKARFAGKKKQGEASEMSLLNQYGGQIMKSLPMLSSDIRHPMWTIGPEARNLLVQEYRSSGSLTKALDKVDVLLATNVAAVQHHIANLGELTTPDTPPQTADERVATQLNIETGFRLHFAKHYFARMKKACEDGELDSSLITTSIAGRLADAVMRGTSSERIQGDHV